jgi:hypothetical protein
MPDEEQAVRAELVAQVLDHPLLGPRIEVDQHVPAEDGIEGSADLRGQVHQVELPELHQRGEFRPDPGVALPGAPAPQQEATQARLAQDLDAGERVDAGARGREDAGIDVRGQDRDRWPLAEGLDRGHRDGVGFLARRGGRAPDPDVPSSLGAASQVIGEDREVIGLPEERRQVGGQGVDEPGPLPAVVRLQEGEVGLEIAPPQLAQAPGEPAVHHRLLAGRERYARAGMDHRADPLEILGREAELAIRR